MTTLSTHDTKRSEDVRARLLALAGDAESWQRVRGGVRRGRRRARRRPAHRSPGLADPGRGRRHRRGPADGVPRQGDARGQAAHRLGGRRPGLRGAGARPGPARPAARARSRALVDTAIDHNAGGGPRAGARPEAAAADRCPACPTPTRAARSSTCRWSTPTTVGPVDYDDRRARLAAPAPTTAPRDLDDEKLLVTHRALALRTRAAGTPSATAAATSRWSATSRHLVGFLRGGEVAVLATRAPPSGSTAAGGWGDADRDAARRAVARRADRGPARAAARCRCADVLADCRSPCCAACTCDVSTGRRCGRPTPARVELVTGRGPARR